MTDPVSVVSGTKETTSGGTYGKSGFKEERKKRKSEAQEGDTVEISQAARDHFPGKKQKSILEYLKDLLD